MLEQLLGEINYGGVFSVDVLAKKFNTTPAMVRVMLEHLQKMNLIEEVSFCDSSCTGCALNSTCSRREQADRSVIFTSRTPKKVQN